MNIAPKKVVSVIYELHSSAPNSERNFVETANVDNPLTFLFGVGSMIPRFETELSGLKTGDKFNFTINADEAYGPSDNEAIVRVPIEVFKVDGAIDFDILKVGNVLPMRDNEGNSLNGKVIGIDPDAAVLDFNHPLAGHNLHFTGEIIEVREATSDEIAHGHAHTPGMHHE